MQTDDWQGGEHVESGPHTGPNVLTGDAPNAAAQVVAGDAEGSFLKSMLEEGLSTPGREALNSMLEDSMGRGAGSSTLPMSVVGRFHGSHLAPLLAHLESTQESGALLVTEHDDQRVLYFSDGRLIGSRSSVLFEYLGRLLYTAGLVSHEGSRPLVEAEDALGAHSLLLWISSAHLSWIVERRVFEVVSALHLVKRGHFAFVPGAVQLECPTVQLSPADVAAEGARRHDALRKGENDPQAIYYPSSMVAPPAKITRELKTIDINPAALSEILERIRRADA